MPTLFCYRAIFSDNDKKKRSRECKNLNSSSLLYKKQSTYKPGSVPFAGCLSFIYIVCHHTTKAFYPPARASNPQTPVYMNLQPPRRTARTSLHGRWALTPPSHPYPVRGGYFLLRYSAFASSFLLGSGVLCAARTFLLCLTATATDRSAVLLVQR